MAQKLVSLRAGAKSVVTKLKGKLDHDNPTEKSYITAKLEEKLMIIKDLSAKILEELTENEAIEREIVDAKISIPSTSSI